LPRPRLLQHTHHPPRAGRPISGWTETWTPVAGADSYNVYLNLSKVGNTTSASYPFTGEQPNTPYQVNVTTVEAVYGESARSLTDTVQTSAVPTRRGPTGGSGATNGGGTTGGSGSSNASGAGSSGSSGGSGSTGSTGGGTPSHSPNALVSHAFDSSGGSVTQTVGDVTVNVEVPQGGIREPRDRDGNEGPVTGRRTNGLRTGFGKRCDGVWRAFLWQSTDKAHHGDNDGCEYSIKRYVLQTVVDRGADPTNGDGVVAVRSDTCGVEGEVG
jgi:hypothetical protein